MILLIYNIIKYNYCSVDNADCESEENDTEIMLIGLSIGLLEYLPPSKVMNESDEESAVFKSLTIELRYFDEEEAEEITAHISNAGGTVVKSSRRESKHYILVPFNYDAECSNAKAEVITSAWLEDCLYRKTLVPIDYYHKPLKFIPKSEPLSGLTFSISMYVGSERKFLSDIATLLGATVKSVLHKRMSTHLICEKPEGAKYEGAVNWGITVVTNKWLLDCLAAEKRLRERPYLVGSSKEPEWENLEENSEPEPKEQSYKCVYPSSMKNKNVNSIKNKTEDSIHLNTFDEKNTNGIVNVEPKDHVLENKLLSQIERQPSNNSSVGRSIMRLSLGNGEMSPASRYIAMNRQGMIINSQGTPENSEKIIKISTPSNDTMSTPPMDNALSTPHIALFSTTSKRRILAVKRGEIPSNPPRTPKNPLEISMEKPESPFGALLRPGSSKISPDSRKKLKRNFDAFPSPLTSKQTKPETPISELGNQFFKKYLEDTPNRKHALDEKKTPNDNTDIQPAKQLKLSEEPNFSNNMEKNKENTNLNSIAIAGFVESQIDTVKVYSFVLSQSITNSEEIKCIIEKLGGTILEGTEFNLNASYFLCSSLCRSEKLLTCLAARKWVLHPDYIIESQKAGRFIDEECYEWGNPKTKISSSSFTEVQRQLANAAYRWRIKPSSSPLPFHSFKVIVLVKESRKDPISRILKAGGGEVVDISPPFKGNINVTHCFVEPQHKPISLADLKFFVTNNIPVCSSLFLKICLIGDPSLSPMDHLCPEYKRLLHK